MANSRVAEPHPLQEWAPTCPSVSLTVKTAPCAWGQLHQCWFYNSPFSWLLSSLHQPSLCLDFCMSFHPQFKFEQLLPTTNPSEHAISFQHSVAFKSHKLLRALLTSSVIPSLLHNFSSHLHPSLPKAPLTGRGQQKQCAKPHFWFSHSLMSLEVGGCILQPASAGTIMELQLCSRFQPERT